MKAIFIFRRKKEEFRPYQITQKRTNWKQKILFSVFHPLKFPAALQTKKFWLAKNCRTSFIPKREGGKKIFFWQPQTIVSLVFIKDVCIFCGIFFLKRGEVETGDAGGNWILRLPLELLVYLVLFNSLPSLTAADLMKMTSYACMEFRGFQSLCVGRKCLRGSHRTSSNLYC